MPLDIVPSSVLTFKGPFDKISSTTVRITNNTKDRYTFNFTTTAPKLFTVKPNKAYIEPDTTINVEVNKQPIKTPDELTNANKHKFVILCTRAPRDFTGNVEEFWKNYPKESENIQEIKLTCVYFDESVGVCLTSIEKMAKMNEDLIVKIDQMTGDIDFVTFTIKSANQQFHIENQTKERRSIQNLKSEWRNSITLVDIDDIFNAKLIFECENYQDLVRLNREMLSSANKYQLLREESNVLENLKKFEENFRRVHSSLQKLFEFLTNGGRDDREDIQGQLDNINNQICHLRHRGNLNFV